MRRRSRGVKPRMDQLAACSSKFSWMFNDHGDDPCKIASVLLGQCTSSGVWTVPSILPTSVYTPPTSAEANACQCNTVVYSLLGACATCQEGSFQSFANWTEYCPSNVVTLQNFPNRTTLSINVPPWASLPLTNGLFDIVRAEQLSMVSSIIPVSTLSGPSSASVASTAPPSPPPSTSPDPVAPPTSSKQKRNQNNMEIAIIVIVTLILVAALIGGYFILKARRRLAAQQPTARGAYAPLFTHPNRQLSISSVESSDTVVDIAPARRGTSQPARPSFLAGLFTNFRRFSPVLAPYTTAQVRRGDSAASPPVKVFLADMAVHPSLPPSQPHSTVGYSNQRPRLARVMTDPLPGPMGGRPVSQTSTDPPQSTIPEPSTSPLSSSQQHASIEGVIRSSASAMGSSPGRDAIAAVVNVPRPSEWHIEDTPTVVGYPTRDAFVGNIQKHRPYGEAQIQGSVHSLSTNSGFDGSWDDSDSMGLLSPAGDHHDQMPPSANSPGIDSSVSTAGSTAQAMSAATASSHTVPDSVRYGQPESRTQLFPASVRAAGYTGVPRRDRRRPQGTRTASSPLT